MEKGRIYTSVLISSVISIGVIATSIFFLNSIIDEINETYAGIVADLNEIRVYTIIYYSVLIDFHFQNLL